MLDRITNAMQVNNNLSHINSNLKRIQKTQEQIASGKTIRVPSDNPIGTTQSMKINTALKKSVQFKKSLETGISYMENTSSLITQIEGVLLDIREIAENAVSVNTTSAERVAFAFEVNQLLEELVQLSNSKFQGKFIFGGTETLSGTQANSSPFNIQLSGTAIASVIPNPDGIDGQIVRTVGEGKQITINISGEDIFQPNGVNGEK
ncbi:hypothetical protein KDK77_09965, partial [bacterium]|nr:hypothetical protein [bacterium]